MQLLQVAAMLGGAASAVFATPNVHHGDVIDFVAIQALTTSTVFTTSVFTITKCGPEVTDCPESGTEIVTSVVALTTTICPVTSTPAEVTVPIVTTGSLAPSVPLDLSSGVVVSSASPIMSILPTTPGETAISTSIVSVPGNSSAVWSESSSHDTFTDAVPTSSASSSVAPASSSAYSGPTDPTDPAISSATPSGPGTPSVGASTNSEGIATSSKTPSLSSSGYLSADPSSTPNDPSATPSGPQATSSANSTNSEGVATSEKSSVSDTPTTVRLTSVITRTLTTVITAPSPGASNSSFVPTTAVITETLTSVIVTKPVSMNSTQGPSTNIEATTTSWATAPTGNPSGFPNVTVNGTVSIPTPSIQPIEDGGDKVFGTSAGSLVAMVIAFIFALQV